jgi:hypothetical protein
VAVAWSRKGEKMDEFDISRALDDIEFLYNKGSYDTGNDYLADLSKDPERCATRLSEIAERMP